MTKRARRNAKPAAKPLTIKERTPGVFGTAIYCRVSTEHQTHDSQLKALRDYCSRRGWDVLVEVFDTASGAITRPQREALLGAARRQEVDAILVFKLDRWGRSTIDLMTSITELSELGVPLVSVSDGLDMTTSAGKALMGMLAVFAGFERDMATERIRAGLDAARARGVRLGRKPLPESTTRRIRELRAQELSLRAISKELGVGLGTVSRALAA